MPSIICSNLSFSWPDGTPVVTDLSLAFGAGRTSLIGDNGAGKSTLLKLFAGILSPTTGTVLVQGTCAYLPQDLTYSAEDSIARLLGIDATLAAIRAFENGDGDAALLDSVGDDWDMEERAIAAMQRLGLPGRLFSGRSILEKTVTELSGGEAMRVALAGILLRRAEVTILDEPTNNLDTASRRSLSAALDDWPGTLLLVSHDRELLDRMDGTAEIRQGKVRYFGGNYTLYLERREQERETAARAVRDAEAALRREKRQRESGQVRAATSRKQGHSQAAKSRFPKAAINLRRNRAEAKAGDRRAEREGRIAASSDMLRRAKAAARENDHITIELPETEVPAGRLVLAMTVGDRTVRVTGPERIVVSGDNGAGKTTLLRALTGGTVFPGLHVESCIDPVGLLPQSCRLFDDTASAVENLHALVPAIGINRAYATLARFLLRGGKADLPVGSLSGGERLRLALACLLSPEPPPRLLLLDEPTNNLDIAGMEELAAALDKYRGALILVSHDRRFLESIRVTREWVVENMHLRRDRPLE